MLGITDSKMKGWPAIIEVGFLTFFAMQVIKYVVPQTSINFSQWVMRPMASISWCIAMSLTIRPTGENCTTNLLTIGF